MFRSVIIFTLLSLLTGGCIREDMSECANCRVLLRYTHNTQGEDLIASQVQDIHLYVFDQDAGLLADVIHVGTPDIARGYIDIYLPDGIYTITAWGGSSEDITQGGFKDAQLTDSAPLTYTSPVTIGAATFDDFRMMLACEKFTGKGDGDIIPKTEQFDHLFFALAQGIPATGKNMRTVVLDFIKNTSILKVSVKGVENLPVCASGEKLSVFVTGSNNSYMYDNRIDKFARQIRYEALCDKLAKAEIQTEVRMLRLDLDKHLDDPVQLHIQNADYENVISSLDVVRTILQTCDRQGNFIYQTQEDIDRESVFTIDILIQYDLSVRVTVNGFETVNLTPDLSR